MAFFIRLALKPQGKIGSENFGQALFSLLKYAIVFLVAIMAVYFITNALHLNDVMIAVILTCLAFVLIAFIFIKKGNEVSPILKDKNLLLIYISYIAVLWHLWFYGFWGGQ